MKINFKHQIKVAFLISLIGLTLSAQDVKEVIEKYTKGSVEWIQVTDMQPEKFLLLDAREREEFEVSKIPLAQFVGYSHFDVTEISRQFPDKNQPIVVYCSLGVRSETVALQLKTAGYKKVFNLYGGIFAWKNEGFDVVDVEENPTEKVHAYSKKWGVYLKKGVHIYE